MNRIILSAAAAIILASCTTNPFTGEQQASRTILGTGTGAAIGGAAGALIGATTSANTRKAALIGAGIGAIAGTGVGAYMDNQEAKLRERLEGTGVSVTRAGDTIVLNMPSNVTFDSGEADVKARFYDTLNSVAIVFQEYNKTLIDVVGHTDADGDENFNDDLSRRRANSVARYFVAQDISSNRFQVEGRGESEPIASNATASGKARNRRVEITIQPLT